MQNLWYNYGVILQAIKAFCLVHGVEPSQLQNDGCNALTAALTQKEEAKPYLHGTEEGKSRQVTSSYKVHRIKEG